MAKLTKQETQLLQGIINTAYSVLLNEILEEDYKQKQWLINAIDFHKTEYKKKETQVDKDIIVGLIEELGLVNQRIERIKNVAKKLA